MYNIVLHYFRRLPEVYVYYYAELDGYPHARFHCDFLKKGHKAREKNLRDYYGFFQSL